MLYRLLRSLWFLLFFMPATVAHLQDSVVYGVFFYSPTCPHCHEVMTNHWPRIQTEFGDQLQVLFVDASSVEGAQIMMATLNAMQIDSNGVPMLVIGEEVLIGSIDIPLRAPDVIRAGIAVGGIQLPLVAALREAFQSALEQSGRDLGSAQADSVTSPETANALGERLAADPFANALAVLILALLIVSLMILIGAGWLNRVRHDRRLLNTIALRGRAIVLLLSLIGLGMSLSLALGWNNDLVVLLIAAGEFIVFLMLAVRCVHSQQPLAHWIVPVVTLAGLAVAGYLTYVETTQMEAVCGVMGNCNLVQQSQYARILNIPIGVIGIAAYIVIAAVFVTGKAGAVLTGLLVFGVAFSAYLTFLEPFVIGASCVWCLTSALLMLMLLWLVVLSNHDVSPSGAVRSRAH